MDIALAIEYIYIGAEYGGSLTANTKESFDNLRWEDVRLKPTWQEVVNAWNEHNPNNLYNE